MTSIKIPENSFKSLVKPSKLLLISLLTIIFSNCCTIFGFNNLDLKTKIIICLSIVSFIFLIDVIVLYVKYYEYYYQAEYLNKIYSLIDINVDNISRDIDKLKSESSDLKETVSKTNDDIVFLKSKIN